MNDKKTLIMVNRTGEYSGASMHEFTQILILRTYEQKL